MFITQFSTKFSVSIITAKMLVVSYFSISGVFHPDYQYCQTETAITTAHASLARSIL